MDISAGSTFCCSFCFMPPPEAAPAGASSSRGSPRAPFLALALLLPGPWPMNTLQMPRAADPAALLPARSKLTFLAAQVVAFSKVQCWPLCSSFDQFCASIVLLQPRVRM